MARKPAGEVGDFDHPLRIEQAPRDFADRELAARKVADVERAAAWAAVGSFGGAPRKATPLRGSTCARCGATDQVLASPSSSGPYVCAFGCA